MTDRELLDDFYRREGGFGVIVHRKADRGGLTHSGVTFKDYNRWRTKSGQIPVNEQEFVALERDDLDQFLLAEFFDPLWFVVDGQIFHQLVDFAMNAGPDDAIRALQQGLVGEEEYDGRIDGIAGPKTRAAWGRVESDPEAKARIALAASDARELFHVERAFDAAVRSFLDLNPRTQLHNLKGWLRRAKAVRA